MDATSKIDVTPKLNNRISYLSHGINGVRSPVTRVVESPMVIPPSPFMKKLGCGTYVTVYKYKRKSACGVEASPWAVKKAKNSARKSIVDRLKFEGELMKGLSHPNIILFKNACQTDKGEYCLSMEVFDNGLDDVIYKRGEEDKIFSSRDIMKVTWSVANALQYLHNEKHLLHGDIKSANVLVRKNFEEVKLCDFGVSIPLNETLIGAKNAHAQYVGSEPWNCREVIDSNYISDKADIFAYGLVIWEMVALDVPHVALMHEESSLENSFTGEDDSFSIPQAYFDALGTRPPLPEYEYTKDYDPMIGIFVCCTIEDYTKRPSASTVVSSLASLISIYDIK